MLKLLISRKIALYLLAAVLVALLISAFLPNTYTLSPERWHDLQLHDPDRFWIYSHFSTPYLVRTPLFLGVSFLLCLSTLACTVDRLVKVGKARAVPFETEKVFSFSVTRCAAEDLETLREKVQRFLAHGKWEVGCEETAEGVILSGQKGRSGLWGSILFHAGLIACFVAGPVTVLGGFRGELIVTGDTPVSLRSTVVALEGYDAARVPDLQVEVKRLRGEYYRGEYRYDFGGILAVTDPKGSRELPFSVNRAANYEGYQFSLSEYGSAPRLVLERDGRPFFDYYLNLRHPEEGDYFDLDGGVRAMVMFFPDFVQQGERIGTKSKRPDHPVTLVRLFRGDRQVFQGLFQPGDEALWEGVRIRVPDFRHWVSLTVTSERGVLLVMLGSLLGVVGLFIRFLSNERRIEFTLAPAGEDAAEYRSTCTIRGYSRYYPAFLEKEVLAIDEAMDNEQ
ncbi:cytochrome c biogenesis protein ResB [Geomesophilobacter sediminis]|uniref:Cytochrome c biogenesis protein ResB n=1 Tax=Geomesophilobacter sediminis TaxID=2798584 RepID=A0A8J7JCV8_9BACT|nr:cytochrome c biogenesis protein ResB [Geomesophilobacter sediminis]MBJ6723114.1 cytochrome c biogenesis protein ResB [Geomesophilobacter sediminis]